MRGLVGVIVTNETVIDHIPHMNAVHLKMLDKILKPSLADVPPRTGRMNHRLDQ